MTFDMRAARQERGIRERLEMLPAALDEIERLRKECSQCVNVDILAQAKRIAELEARCNSLHSVSRRRKAEIEDLISDRITNLHKIRKQRAAIRCLREKRHAERKALVEERASLLAAIRICAKHPAEAWEEVCDDDREEARRQLRQEKLL